MLQLHCYFPRILLGFYPSPLHKLSRLSKELGYNIWAKRDDMCSGVGLGGNKIRKLEWLLADALSQSCDTLVSIGGIQSNHTRQVTAAAAVLGMKCYTVQETWAEWDDEIYDKVGNILLSRLMGGTAIFDGYGYSTAEKVSLEKVVKKIKRQGGKPYVIPAGASAHPLGGLGYANFADEVLQQEKKLNIFFDTIIVATCTGSTQAGMIAGFAAQKRKRRIIGIDTADDVNMTRQAVTQSAYDTIAAIAAKGGKHITLPELEIEINPSYSAPGYGIPSQQTINAIRMAAELEAMITDPVYEGKSMAGLIDLSQKKEFKPNSNILYVHLGGTPALNAYYQAFQEHPIYCPLHKSD